MAVIAVLKVVRCRMVVYIPESDEEPVYDIIMNRLDIVFASARLLLLVITTVTLFNWFWRRDLVLVMGIMLVHEAIAFSLDYTTK